MVHIETLQSLTEDELAMLLYILNEEPPLPITEVTPQMVLSYKLDALTWKLSQWEPRVKDEFKEIFNQLMFKISNVKPRNTTENGSVGTQPSGSSGEVSGSDNPRTGSESSQS